MGNSNTSSGPKPENFEEEICRICRNDLIQRNKQIVKGKILCLDGGGVRSIITLNYLKRIELLTDMKVFLI